VGSRAGLDRCGKSRPPQGFDPWTVQSVANRYTDYIVPAQVQGVLCKPGNLNGCHYFRMFLAISSYNFRHFSQL
jgi:hypothetical protein